MNYLTQNRVKVKKKVTHLKKVKESYFRIQSGLGEGKAAEVLIIPLIYQEKAIGVLEVATFSTFPDEAVKLAVSVCEYLAGAIANAQLQDRLKSKSERSFQEAL